MFSDDKNRGGKNQTPLFFRTAFFFFLPKWDINFQRAETHLTDAWGLMRCLKEPGHLPRAEEKCGGPLLPLTPLWELWGKTHQQNEALFTANSYARRVFLTLPQDSPEHPASWRPAVLWLVPVLSCEHHKGRDWNFCVHVPRTQE